LIKIKPTVEVDPLLRLSAIIGDVVTNARASLDILFFGLVEKHFVPPFDVTNQNDRRITAFPIWSADGAQGYLDRLNRLSNRKIPTPVIDEIKAVQPNVAGYESIGLLQYLVNTDKHRALLVSVGAIEGAEIVITSGTWRGLVRGERVRDGVTFRADKILSRAGIEDGTVQVNAQAAIQITWRDPWMPRERVEVTLEEVIVTTSNIVDKIGRFL
jgi:hypothetical protein